MSNERAIAVISEQPVATQFGQMSVLDVIARKKKIAEVMQEVMRDGVHYGVIPGCGDKPTLYKSGAEILTMTFCLAPTYKIDRIDLPGGHREYQVVCTLTHIASGCALGEGLGAATTMESKHRWRWRGGGRVENPDPADQYNTALKMAKKRALVDCTLTATGASDVLAQDLEDLAPEDGADAPPARQARPAQARNVRSSGGAERPRDPDRGAQPPDVTEDAIVEILTAIGRCSSEGDLKDVGSRIPYGRMRSATRERVMKAYGEQLAEIRHATATKG